MRQNHVFAVEENIFQKKSYFFELYGIICICKIMFNVEAMYLYLLC